MLAALFPAVAQEDVFEQQYYDDAHDETVSDYGPYDFGYAVDCFGGCERQYDVEHERYAEYHAMAERGYASCVCRHFESCSQLYAHQEEQYRSHDSRRYAHQYPDDGGEECYCYHGHSGGNYRDEHGEEIDENGNVFLGSVVICEQRAREQAEEYGHSFERELWYLAVHGLLHCFGYDHMAQEDKREMREKEEYVMKKLSLERDI